MSTQQPSSQSHAPADPNRSWIQQTDAAPPSTSQHPPPPVPQPNPQLQPSPADGQQYPARQPTIVDAMQTIKPSDFLTFHQAPCARTGLLAGIGAGAAVGALRWIMGLPVPRAANWAVGTGVLGAIGQYEYCQFRRHQEREKVKRVVEVYAAKQAREKKEKEEQERREREKALAKEREEAEKRRRRWWRFW
ncbi:cytochrome oxidase biogenesis protein, Cox20 subunit [Thermothelomyces heterothallicus CBS 203.75]